MKTISMQTNSVGTMNHPQDFLRALQSSRRVAEWLPAPPIVKAPARKVARTKSIWISPLRETLAEKALMLGLVTAAAIGIGYGLNCLLNLVGNWAAVNASIHSMLQ